MYDLLIHFDTETTGLDGLKNGVHSVGFIGEIVNQNDPINTLRIEFLGYWEFNPDGRERDNHSLKVGGVTHEELDARESHTKWHEDILRSLKKTIAIAKGCYGEDMGVYLVGSYPQYDVNMIDGMNWGWSLSQIFSLDNIINTKTGYKELVEEGKLSVSSYSLQSLVDEFSLRKSVEFISVMLHGGGWYTRFGNANPFERPNPHTAIYDCICTIAVLRHSSLMGGQ